MQDSGVNFADIYEERVFDSFPVANFNEELLEELAVGVKLDMKLEAAEDNENCIKLYWQAKFLGAINEFHNEKPALLLRQSCEALDCYVQSAYFGMEYYAKNEPQLQVGLFLKKSHAKQAYKIIQKESLNYFRQNKYRFVEKDGKLHLEEFIYRGYSQEFGELKFYTTSIHHEPADKEPETEWKSIATLPLNSCEDDKQALLKKLVTAKNYIKCRYCRDLFESDQCGGNRCHRCMEKYEGVMF